MGHKKTRQPRKHLTLSDRFYIEQELLQGSSFKKIGGMLQKDPTTISKEIRRNAKHISNDTTKPNKCYYCKGYMDCRLRGWDAEIHCSLARICNKVCRRCWNKNITEF